MKQVFKVPDISCDHCKMRIEKALTASGIVGSWVVDVACKTVSIDSQTDRAVLARILSDSGYDPVAD